MRQPALPAGITRLAFGIALVAAALVAACGGGGGSPATSTPSGTAGAYAAGPITGFGSIIVAGVRFDTSNASVDDDDGHAADASALKLGTTVEVESSAVDDAHHTAQALRIHFGSEIVGPVAAIDTAGSTLSVLGQTVEVRAETVFGEGLSGGLAALHVGDVLEVHALFDAASGHYAATRIELDADAAVYRLRGIVASLDTTAKTFAIGGATISYAGIAAADLPAGFANGLRVRVRLQTTQVNGQWVALSIRAGMRRVDDHDHALLRGRVSAFTSSAQFSVDGIAVDASGAAFPQGAAGLALGVEVLVEGTMSNGTVVASRVILVSHLPDADRLFELHGTLSALDTSAKTFVLRGITVDYSGSVTFEGGTAADLANDKRVEVQGHLSADHLKLTATKIEFGS